MIAQRSMEGESVINQQENNPVTESFEELVEESGVMTEDTNQEETGNTSQEQSESSVVEGEMDTGRCDQITSEGHPVDDNTTSTVPDRTNEVPTGFTVPQQVTTSGSKRSQESLVQSSSEKPSPKRAKGGFKWKTQDDLDESYSPETNS